MKLSLKATRFIVEALEHFQTIQKQKLTAEDLSENEVSDLANDQQYLEEIKRDLLKHQVELADELAAAGTHC